MKNNYSGLTTMKTNIDVPSPEERARDWVLVNAWNRDNAIGVGGTNYLTSRDVYQRRSDETQYLVHEAYSLTGQRAIVCDRETVTQYLAPAHTPTQPTPQLVCGVQVQIDRSGLSHAWRDIDAADIPSAVREEIEGEIVGGMESADDFVASNDQHYRW